MLLPDDGCATNTAVCWTRIGYGFKVTPLCAVIATCVGLLWPDLRLTPRPPHAASAIEVAMTPARPAKMERRRDACIDVPFKAVFGALAASQGRKTNPPVRARAHVHHLRKSIGPIVTNDGCVAPSATTGPMVI